MMNLSAVHILTRRDERYRAEDGRPRSPRTAVPARLISVSPLSLGPGPERSPREVRTSPPRVGRGEAPPAAARKAPGAPGSGRRRRGCHVGAGRERVNAGPGLECELSSQSLGFLASFVVRNEAYVPAGSRSLIGLGATRRPKGRSEEKGSVL